MRYISTRGQTPPRSFSHILIGGLAADGGLVVPEHYPQVTTAQLESWRGCSYAELASSILELFVTDIPGADLRAIVADSYDPERFGGDDVAPLLSLTDDLHLLQLANGPTLAFKDIAMQLLGNLFQYVLAPTGQRLNILGATSGDTGSSAEYAMLGKANVAVFMLSPYQVLSPFQAAQMFALDEPNIFNIAVRGVFDDCQDIVKAVNEDAEFKSAYHIGAVNSINWARVAAQIVYYFKGWLAATSAPQQEVSFAVPSGNFGNVCAGHIARQMGLPVRHLIVATNENDVLDEFFRSGIYRPRPSAQVVQTSSPSMDISKASNFERFVFDLVGRRPEIVRSLWSQLRETGGFDLSESEYFQRIPDFGFVSGSSNHAQRMQTIAKIYEKYGQMVDTHTADGIAVGRRFAEPGVPLLCLETAQPAKFAASIKEALGVSPPRPRGYEDLERLPQIYEVMDADVSAVRQYLYEHAQT
jgi:threonine synthase